MDSAAPHHPVARVRVDPQGNLVCCGVAGDHQIARHDRYGNVAVQDSSLFQSFR
jgi:hypothetical protein